MSRFLYIYIYDYDKYDYSWSWKYIHFICRPARKLEQETFTELEDIIFSQNIIDLCQAYTLQGLYNTALCTPRFIDQIYRSIGKKLIIQTNNNTNSLFDFFKISRPMWAQNSQWSEKSASQLAGSPYVAHSSQQCSADSILVPGIRGRVIRQVSDWPGPG